MTDLTPRQRFIAAVERKPVAGRAPHFELVFYLTMEAFGKVHPSHCYYGQFLDLELRLHRHAVESLRTDARRMGPRGQLRHLEQFAH